MESVEVRVEEFLKKHNLLDKTIVVGFSGGYDSMCLLDILAQLKNKYFDMTIIAAHFNHNWRGEEALREQEICRIFANSRGIEFYTKTASSVVKKTENDARIARYEFFEEVYEEYDADAVFTAHNYDDNAETVLYRIIKGTGITGLKGISEKRSYFYRPLLKSRRSEIVDYCNQHNLTPNNDSSNSNTAYRRNYLRLNVFPSLEKINVNVKDALNTLAINACNDNEIVEDYLKTIRPNVIKDGSLVSYEYAKLSRPVKLRFLYEYIQSLDLDYDYKKICEIYNFIEKNLSQRNGSTMSLTSALWLYADEKIIETIPPKKKIESDRNFALSVVGEGEYQTPNKKLFVKKYVEKDLFIFPEATSSFAYVDFSNVEFPLTLRFRRDGDVISPFGMTGSMKLKKYLNAKGVTRHNRDSILLLCKENEVLWVVGVGISSKIGVKDEPTHVIEIN